MLRACCRWHEGNPDFASMRYEADAATERITPAGALPDPKLRTELMDITKGGSQSASCPPAGSVARATP
jgi:hypothetical protein